MDRYQNLLAPAHLFMIIFYGMLVGLAISLIPVILVYLDFQRIPRGFRKIEPGLVFLLLIPCFHLVWNFFVFPGLSDSFKAYFNSLGDNSVGSCGRELGLGYSICVAVSAIPFVGCLTGIVALVLLILFLIKANDLKNRIPLTA